MNRKTSGIWYGTKILTLVCAVALFGCESEQTPAETGSSDNDQASGPPAPPPVRGSTDGGTGAAAVGPSGQAAGMPATTGADESAQRDAAGDAQSKNNLRQIVLALHNYHDVAKSFPPGCSTDQEGTPLLSWRVQILPYLGANQLYQQFHLDEPWDSAHNQTLIAQMPDVFRAPGSAAAPGMTVYLGNASEKGVFAMPEQSQFGRTRAPQGMHLREIRDGTANTLALVEASDAMAVVWTQPGDFVPSTDDPLRGLGAESGKIVGALCDGSVWIFNASDPKFANTFRALLTRDGGEVVELY